MTPRDWIHSRAKQMRAEMTPHEKAMWRLLHEGDLIALNWRRQAAFGDYILDFVSHPARMVVEVDGGQHAEAQVIERDEKRSAWLRAEGYHVIRVWNADVLKEPNDVWQSIQAAALRTQAAARMLRWREADRARACEANARIASSSMEEAPRSGGGGAPPVSNIEPPKAHSSPPLASPPQSSLRDDSSSIEEERY